MKTTITPAPADEDYDTALQVWMGRPSPGTPEAPEADPFGGAGPDAGHLEAVERVAGWTRTRFALTEDTVVLVSEIACTLPGCPPLETVIAFWENGQRFHFKLFKPVNQIGPDDLPFAWLKETLVMPEGFGCECC
jgi:nitrate reductase delta subunit